MDDKRKSYSFRLNPSCENDNIIRNRLDEVNKTNSNVSDFIKEALIYYIKQERGEFKAEDNLPAPSPHNNVSLPISSDLEMINSIVNTLKVVNDTSLEIYNKMKNLSISEISVSRCPDGNNDNSSKEETEDVNVISLNKDTEEEIDDETMASLMDFLS